MKEEIMQLITTLEKEKFKIKITNKDEIITMKKSTLCDRLINLLKLL